MKLLLEENQQVYDRYLEFRALLAKARAANPLKSSNGYYPFRTIEIIPQILPLFEKHNMRLVEYIEGKAVMDLGCGDGDLSFFFELFNRARVTAADWGPSNYNGMEAFHVLKAAFKSRVNLLNLDIHSFDFRKFPSFDTTLCFGFLYHSRHPLWVLEKLARVTRHLFLTSRIFDSDQPYVYFYDVGESNNDPTNWWCFTPRALTLMLKRAGFEVLFAERLDHQIGKSHPVDPSLDGRIFIAARSSI